ncbi:MAG TPA: SDR family oxidoreductase [Candidatus Angelobacter sp.]|jgi:thioester reductase-like protein|nr:SDR family oxidoreductase [Candidatus Angelobacter sp.]
MRETVLITGGTGMIGRQLVARICAEPTVEKVFVLARRPSALQPHVKLEVIRGDIECPGLGMELQNRRLLAQTVTTIIHGAALTSFSSELAAARAVNVEGTEWMLQLAADCLHLRGFCHLSTVYVCGRRTGRVCETELEHDSGFVNAYEQSKYEAEQLVQSESYRLPTSIVRLSTVIGDSSNGVVNKVGGIHHAMRMVFHGLAPFVPGKKESAVDLIPLDYAVESVSLLGLQKFAPYTTWHVCGADDALSLEAFLDATVQLFYQHRPAWRKRAIEMPAIVNLETFELFVRSIEEVGDSALVNSVTALKYFVPQLAYPKHISDAATQAVLKPAGIVRAGMRDFYPKIVRFLLENNWQPIDLERMAS